MQDKVLRSAGVLLATLAAAACMEDPVRAAGCQYGIYPPGGVQLRVGETRFVQSTTSCETDQGTTLVQPLAWTSSDSTVVSVRPEPTSPGATLRAKAVGSATITATYSAGDPSAFLAVQVMAGP